MFITSKGSTVISYFSMDVLCVKFLYVSFVSCKPFWGKGRMRHYLTGVEF